MDDIAEEGSDSDVLMDEFITDVTDISDLSEESDEVTDSLREPCCSLDSGYECLVFENCPLSVDASTLLIKKFQMRHNLTNEGLPDLLYLL